MNKAYVETTKERTPVKTKLVEATGLLKCIIILFYL